MFRNFSFNAYCILLSVFLITSCNKDEENSNALDPNNYTIPLLTTDNVTEITQQSAVSGGKISSDGSASITSRGICWSTIQYPTIADSKVELGPGSSNFSCPLSGLTVGTTYFVRAFAINKAGIGYGAQVNFATSDSLIIGVNYAGGIIFYLDSTGMHGFVSSFTDQSTNAQWGCPNFQVPGADGTAIGTGAQNTKDLINSCSAYGYASSICDSLILNGYNDWFLPSKEELKLMYTNLKTAGVGDFSNYAYWSSTEMTSVNAWQVIFNNGLLQGAAKNGIASVRAVRAF